MKLIKKLILLFSAVLLFGCAPAIISSDNVSIECKGKFTVTVAGPASGSVTGDCGEGASYKRTTSNNQ